MLTHIRLDSEMENAIEEAMGIELYKNKSEFIRAAIREKINSIRKDKALKILASLKGSTKGKPFTKEERIKNAEEFFKMKGFDK